MARIINFDPPEGTDEEWFPWEATYEHEGVLFGIGFYARDKNEARCMVMDMKETLRFNGRIIVTEEGND